MNRSLGRNWLRVQIERCYVSAIANFFGNCPFSVSFPLAFLTSDLEILLKDSQNDQKALYHRGDSSRTLGRAGGSLAVISGDMVSSWWLYDGKTQKGTVDSISHWADFRQLTLYHTYFGSFSTTSSRGSIEPFQPSEMHLQGITQKLFWRHNGVDSTRYQESSFFHGKDRKSGVL